MGCVDSGDRAYRVSLPVGHVDHSVSQLPVVPVILPDLVQPCPQETDYFAVSVVVPYEIPGGDVGVTADTCDGAVGKKMPRSAAFPAGSGFHDERGCRSDMWRT